MAEVAQPCGLGGNWLVQAGREDLRLGTGA